MHHISYSDLELSKITTLKVRTNFQIINLCVMIKNSNHILLQDIAYTGIINFDNDLEHTQIT